MDWSHSPQNSSTRQALIWNPEGRGKRGRAINIWRRDLEADVKETGYIWRQLDRLAQDRSAWWSHIGGYAQEGARKALIY